ncbi:MAG TPA: hypothetical protein VNL91_02020 [Thermoanaerobaculia bacterium]|nr:hypothetical protein [Thermoanaerobaculia bacterium]
MRYALAMRDELWAGGMCLESRFECGGARADGDEIDARDEIDPLLASICEREIEGAREAAALAPGARVRIVARAEREEGRERVSSTITITDAAGVSIVTTRENAGGDLQRLRAALARPVELSAPPKLPMVWRNGSAAILFHEAAGHPAEHRCTPLVWPSWLRVEDVAEEGRADLLAGELPRAVRRESFRDVPMPRMTSLVVSQDGAPFTLPDERVEIAYVTDGSFDPFRGIVTVRVAVAEEIAAGRVRRIAPFAIRIVRARVAESLLGAAGAPERYPGVVCSSEGQQLIVGSHAPVVVTATLT